MESAEPGDEGTVLAPGHPIILLRTALTLFGAVFVLRAVLLEPYGVSTGSMAPSLLGVHRAVACPRCGFPVRVGAPPDGAPVARHYASAYCPNCGQGDLDLESRPDLAGDRLLVEKNVFECRSPRRWEVAAFRGPEGMARPYVKRVVGLPGEAVLIRDGDVLVNGTLARKTLAECRAMRVPVFDQSFAPPGGWVGRWALGPETRADRARADVLDLEFSAEEAAEFQWLVYRHRSLDGAGEEPIRDGLAYNGGREDARAECVHDFTVTCEVRILGGSGEVACVLTDGQDDVTALLPAAESVGAVRLKIRDETEPPSSSLRLTAGRTYQVELAFVDRRALLAVDGRLVVPPLDLPPTDERSGVPRPLKIGARGVAAVVRNVRLYRDVHYAAAGRHGTRTQCQLGPDEYFMLGDNSGNSEDSRFWDSPGVPARAFVGKPLFLHRPSRWAAWHLPGRVWDGPAVDWGRG